MYRDDTMFAEQSYDPSFYFQCYKYMHIHDQK